MAVTRDIFWLPTRAQSQDGCSGAAGQAPRRQAKAVRSSWDSFKLDTMDTDNSPPSPNSYAAYKSLARKGGFPAEKRPGCWLVLSGALKMRLAHGANYYQTLSASTADIPDEVIFTVEDDVRSTYLSMRHHPMFATAKSTEALSRVLLAYAQRNADNGYVRGMSQMAAVLMVVMGKGKEEEVFWTLAALLEEKLFPYCHGQVQYGGKVEGKVLQAMVVQKLPRLAEYLSKLHNDALSVLTHQWFTSAFTAVLPIELVLRVWDCLFVEGTKVAHRVALAMLKTCANSVHSCKNTDVLRKVMESRLARLTPAESEVLLSTAFGGLGSFSGNSLVVARTAACQEVDRQLMQQRSRLAALITRTSPPTSSSSS